MIKCILTFRVDLFPITLTHVHINSYIMLHSGWYTEQFTLKPQMNLMCIPQRKLNERITIACIADCATHINAAQNILFFTRIQQQVSNEDLNMLIKYTSTCVL